VTSCPDIKAWKVIGGWASVLPAVNGLTLREIGGALNLTEGRISQILHRALAKLKEALSESLEPLERR
jgi:DNA-directed RNA polymerase specialized sigma24 family protein